MPDKIDEKISKKCDSTDGTTCDSGTDKVTLGGEGDSQLAIIDSDGISTGGKNLVKRKGDELHIGENSLVTVESGGRQKLYATDANGDAIDIDITNGSRLLINGRDVEKSIDNVGALFRPHWDPSQPSARIQNLPVVLELELTAAHTLSAVVARLGFQSVFH